MASDAGMPITVDEMNDAGIPFIEDAVYPRSVQNNEASMVTSAGESNVDQNDQPEDVEVIRSKMMPKERHERWLEEHERLKPDGWGDDPNEKYPPPSCPTCANAVAMADRSARRTSPMARPTRTVKRV